jgi:RimJ/RimL family protein N-acetyltransferase
MPTELALADFAFHPLVEQDIARIVAWCSLPHAARFFGRGRTVAEIEDEYRGYLAGREPIFVFTVRHRGRPVGVFHWERLGDFPSVQRAYRVGDSNASNIDVLLGDPGVAHRGLGAPLIRRFLDEHVFADPRITCCVIDPWADNAIAIRAYAKAGFVALHDVTDPEDGVRLHLMKLDRPGGATTR